MDSRTDVQASGDSIAIHMDGDEASVHVGLDSWLFVAIATPSSEFASPLANLIADADYLQHSIPTAAQLEHAIRDLSGAELITADSPFALTTKGQRVWKEIGGTTNAYEIIARAGAALGGIPCVSGALGWSIDQRSWEDAVATYSPQFALDLKRKRAQAERE